ncbi:MAG TPA: Hint domain-containing protein [Stellaceae bacterium]|nr:Hint domain-containing protein [Stellaceae bacterium]
MSTITGTVTNSITIGSGTYTSPLTIAAGATVSISSTAAIAVYSSRLATLVDYGLVSAADSADSGIVFGEGGYISIGTAGDVNAYQVGVKITSAAGTVNNAGTVEGNEGIFILAGGTATNTGTVEGRLGIGIYLYAGGSVDNSGTTALIDGAYSGVEIYGAAGTVTNAGTIEGGVNISRGSVDNSGTAALIEGAHGIFVEAAAGTATNVGTIEGTQGAGYGIDFYFGGSVDNSGLVSGISKGIYIQRAAGTVTNHGRIQATGASGIGVDLVAGGTVIDSGTITAASGTAVHFGGTGGNLLELEAGYKFTGSIVGSGSAGVTNTLELSGALGGVTVNYNSLNLTNFQYVDFAAPTGSHDETLVIGNTASRPGTIEGFTAFHDIIDLTNFTYHTGASVTETGDVLTIVSGSETLTLNLAGNYPGIHWAAIEDAGTGTDVIVATCFRRGTRIRTADGEAPVEDLAIGDKVATLSGEARPVRWIGRRAFDGRFIAGNRHVLPIRIAKDALADGVPARDLWVSPGHSMYLDGVFVLAEHLMNGATIVQAEAVERVEYFHVELDTHDILFAEGAPAESYVDCDNRLRFANAAEYEALYPDDERPRWGFCRPVLDWSDDALTAIRARLLARAEALGHPLETDAGLYLLVDGARLDAEMIGSGAFRFMLPAGAAAVSLVSRTAVPAEGVAESRDLRRLGVPVERLVLHAENLRIEAGHGHRLLADGFHDDEQDRRWTDGCGLIPAELLRPFAGAGATLEVHLAPSSLGYRTAPDRAAA